jgi:hypothetical protein
MMGLCHVLPCQEWGIQLKTFPRLAYQGNLDLGWSGNALGLSSYLITGERTALEVGLEAGYVNWGGQAMVNIGFQYLAPFARKSWFFIGGQTQQGFALFRPSPLYTGGLAAQVGLGRQLSNRLIMSMHTGPRFYISPGYREYSAIYHYLDWPLELQFRFTRIRKEWPVH